MKHVITFFIPGIPQTQGSKKAFVIPGTNRATIVDAKPKALKCWRSAIADAALTVWHEAPTRAPISMFVRFYFPRPKSHFRTGKNSHLLSDRAPIYHVGKPDVDKLGRAILDALTGVVYHDDSQVFQLELMKVYVVEKQKPGAKIRMWSGGN